MTELSLEQTEAKQLPDLTDKEKDKLLAQFAKLDKDVLKDTLEAIGMMIRAFDGKPVEPDDVITRLINVKHIWERSRFPTFPIVQEQVYCRLLAKYHPELEAFTDYADIKAEALIPLKGENWYWYNEFLKSQAGSGNVEQTEFNFNTKAEGKHGRIFNRAPKQPQQQGVNQQ